MVLELVGIAPGVSQRPANIRPRCMARCHAYVLERSEGRILVEPAVDEDHERDEWIKWGKAHPIDAIVITHDHPDHTWRVQEIAEGLRVPIWGPEKKGSLLGWQTLDAPGHDDHEIVLWDGRVLVLGDAHNVGTGNPHELIQTIEKLVALNPEIALPAHGRPLLEHSFAPWTRLRMTDPSQAYP